MESKQKRKSITKSLWAITLAFMMLLSTFTGFMDVEVRAAKGIPAPTIDDVFYEATSISGKNLYRERVGKKTERATVHVKLTGTNGEKANVSVTPKNGSTWTVTLPEGVKVAKGDKVTVYQEFNGKKSPEATADAQPSLNFKYKDTLKMPEGEIWIEHTDSNLVNDDEKAEAIEMLKKANPDIAGKFKSVKFTINGTTNAYFEITYTDNSKSDKIEATNLKIKQVTLYSQVPTIAKSHVVDNQITITLEKEIAVGTKIGIVQQFVDRDANNFCSDEDNSCATGNCNATKSNPKWVTVESPTKTFTYNVSDEFLKLGQDFGVIVKEPHKFASCKRTQPRVKIPNVDVRDPKKLTDVEKDKIREEIRKANTINGKSKLPDGTAFKKGIPAIIEVSDNGKVKIISPNDVDGEFVSGEDGRKFVPKTNEDGTVVVSKGREDSVIPFDKPEELLLNLAPNQPTIGYDKKNHIITVTPDKADTDAKTVVVEYQDPDGNKKTETVEKGDDGKWKVVVPEGSTEQPKIKVDEKTGVVTIKDSDIKNKTNVSATVTDEGGIAANDTNKKTSDNKSEQIKIYPKKPAITVDTNDGSVTITPVDKDDDKVAKKMDITYTPVGKDETKTVTVERKDDGTWTVPDGSDFKVSEDGNSITITNDKIKSKTKITAQTNDGDADPNQVLKSDKNEDTVPDKTAPQPPKVEVNTTDGTAHITPPTDPDTKTIEVKYPGADGNKKTFTATKTDTGWEISGDDGVSFEMNGYISIPYDKLKKADTISATAKDGDGNVSKQGTDISLPPAPTAKENEGVITVTPPENTPAVNGMEITYTPDGSEEAETFKLVKGNDDKWKIDGDTPDGVTVSENGTVTIASGTAKEKTKVTAISSIDITKKSLEKGEADVPETKAPEAPTVKVQEDGSVKITPKDKGETTVTVTYKDQDGNDKTATATKGKNGEWTVTGDNGETIDKTTGVITIPTGNTNPGDRVRATASKGNKTSTENNDLTKPAPPTVTPDQESGNVTINPPSKGNVDGMIIKYKTPDGTDRTVTAKKGTDKKWKIDGDNPDGVTIVEGTGVVTIPKGKAKEKTPVTADSTIETLQTPDKNQGEKPELVPDKTAPNPPTVEVEDNGNVTVTPPTDEDTTKVTVIYKKADGSQVTVVAKKANNAWTLTGADGTSPVTNDETIDTTSGVITLPKGKYQTGEEVKAYGNDNADNKSTDDSQTPVEVTFNGNKGTGNMEGKILIKDGEYTLPENKFTPPENQEFAGWQVGNETKNVGDKITVTENTTVTAKYKPITVDVSFDKGEGSGNKDKVSVAKGSKYTLPDGKEFTPPENQKFVGWEVNGEAKNVGDTITVNENTTVTAKYKPIMVDVSFDKGEGSGEKAKVSVAKGSEYILPNSDGFTAPENKEFEGWKVGDEEDVKKAGTEITVNENTILTAVYRPKSATPTPDKTPNPPTVTVNNDRSVTIAPPTTGEVDGMGIKYIPTGETTETTIIAKKENNTWKIDGNTPDGISINGSTGVVTIAQDKAKEESKVTAVSKLGSKESTIAEGTIPKSSSGETPQPPTPPTPNPPQDVKNPSVSVDYNGNLIITPPTEGDVTSVSVTYKNEENSKKTPKAIKDNEGNWTIENNDNGETVDGSSGVITIPKGKYKLGEAVIAVANNNQAQSGEATETPVEIKLMKNDGSDKSDSSITIKNQFYVLPAIYDLPEYMYTAPDGKEFDGWEINGVRKSVGEKIQITDNTVVKAIWRDKPVENSGYHGYFYEPNTDIDYYRPNKDFKPVEEVKPKEEYKPAEEFEIGRHFRYLYGYVDHTVRPEGMITRSEAAALIARLANLDMTDNSKPNFKDTPSAWYNTAINAVVKLNLMFADKDGNFRPQEAITRAEFARALFYIDKKNDAVAPFADVKGHEFEAAINQAYGNGLIVGYLDGTFKPDAFIQRAEAAKILNKYANRGVTLEGMSAVKMDLKHFIDIDQNHWAYCEIMEAANSHEYRRVKGTLEETWTMIIPDDIMK